VVVVNDGSQDSTADHTCAAGAAVIVHPFNLGQGGALRTGIKCAIAQAADIIVIFDVNRQHQVSDIVGLTDALIEECRFRAGQPVSRTGSGSSSAPPPATQA
jgi:glycosyltransferase involved in cell wall biosynthesis